MAKRENEQELSKRELRRRRRIRNQIISYISLAVILIVVCIGGFLGIRKVISSISEKKQEQELAKELAEMETAQAQSEVQEPSTVEAQEYTEDDLLKEVVDSCLSAMTLEDKVAGLFLVTPESLTGVDIATKAGESTREALAKYPVGGIIYFGQNIISKEQFQEMVSFTNDNAKYPLFLAVDEEGGKVSRIANSAIKTEKVEDAGKIGKTGDSGEAYNAMQTIAAYMAEYGLNLDFAPVADILTNESNTTIGARSYGSDPAVVAEMTAKAVDGLQDNGISACVKHFPGLGGTNEDTETELASTERTKEQMAGTEFQSFTAAINAGTDMIMVSHLSVPAIVGDNTPSSLSEVMISDILRGELGYQGIVITDALDMGAITEYYTSVDAGVKALEAGADMLLMPENFEEAYQGVLDAVKSGALTEDRIEESLERIYRVKYRGVIEE